MLALYKLIDLILSLANTLIIVGAIISWLINFQILNSQNRTLNGIITGIMRLSDILLNPIRRFVPNVGGFDLSPLVAILLIYFLRNLLVEAMPLY